jgi:AcrR family transcriptional regulator
MGRGRPREGQTLAVRGEQTRGKIYAAALTSFRKRGFDATTMRDVAREAGVALGAAYYYFPSKEAIVLAYYRETLDVCSARERVVFARSSDVRERLGAAFHTKLDVLKRDRKLLAALFERTADPTSPISVFAERTEDVRERTLAAFDEALATSAEVQALDERTRRVLALAFFSLHLGVMLLFIRDDSPGQRRTRRLVDRTLDLVTSLLPLAPQLAPVFGDAIGSILAEADLLDESPRKS